jgi:hypothetical protein
MEVIERETPEATLLSVGSRGVGRIKRMRLGSTSAKAMRIAGGPVLIHPGHPSRAPHTPDTEYSERRRIAGEKVRP